MQFEAKKKEKDDKKAEKEEKDAKKYFEKDKTGRIQHLLDVK